MPVSFAPATHQATPVRSTKGELSPNEILKQACPSHWEKVDEMLQSSFGGAGSTSSNVCPKKNGFVDTVVLAYNQHHALVIRPDDVWLAILSQFNAFVNANAEQLRSVFVAHEGQRELTVVAQGNRYNVDFGSLSRQMVDLMSDAIVDQSLTDWIIPSFTTTTLNDKTVSCMLMMATMKAYFSYGMMLMCGIPRVTLEGTKEDWEKLRSKIEKLKTYGVECVAWYHLLAPVLDRFVCAFDEPDGAANIDFWQRVAHYEGGGSGPTYLTGWITAFCAFSDEGKWLGSPLRKEASEFPHPETLTAEEFWSVFKVADRAPRFGEPLETLTLDGTAYHSIDTDDIPVSYAEVDVKLDDNGVELKSMLVAGLVGSEVQSSGDAELSSAGVRDVVKPLAGWWMFTKRGDVEKP